jgi:hypothetical protein
MNVREGLLDDELMLRGELHADLIYGQVLLDPKRRNSLFFGRPFFPCVLLSSLAGWHD